MANPLTPILREPLTYFLLAGAVLFFVWDWFEADPGNYHIEITTQERERIRAQWEGQMDRKPSAEEMTGLVEQFVREEVYYREALLLGLDQNDTIIRRRLAQKLEFLTEDIATAKPAGEQELRTFYDQHQANYSEPGKYAFTHHYFSTERRSDSHAVATRAIATLNTAPETAPPGDPFMLQAEFVARSVREIADLFGSDFALGIAELAPGMWQGPVRSAYGWHAVMLQEHTPARQQAYEEVAARVANDYAQNARDDANKRYYKSLRDRYQVTEL